MPGLCTPIWPTGGAMRGYGIPQAAFAAECMADDLAPGPSHGPVGIQEKNCMRPGYVDPTLM